MAKISFNGQSEYFQKLQQLEATFAKDSTIEKAVAAGAAPVADEIRKRLNALPKGRSPYVYNGQMLVGLTPQQIDDLDKGFGLTPIGRDKKGFVHVKAGFEGHGSKPTPTYPNGVPNQLLACAVEYGSSVRFKIPFVAPSVRTKREESIKAMALVIDEAIEKFFKE